MATVGVKGLMVFAVNKLPGSISHNCRPTPLLLLLLLLLAVMQTACVCGCGLETSSTSFAVLCVITDALSVFRDQ